jgi:hypothetical protein
MTTLLVTIALALFGASVTFVGIILSKEQRVSEFRLSWLEALREDIASLIARALAIHGVHVNAGGPPPANSQIGMKLTEDFLEINKVSIRIRLRLNPNKETHKPVILLMDEIEELFGKGIGNAPFDQIDKLADKVTDASQQLLKSVWEEVKNGEPAFRVTKWVALAISIIAIGLLAIGIYFQVNQAYRRSPPAQKSMQHIASL